MKWSSIYEYLLWSIIFLRWSINLLEWRGIVLNNREVSNYGFGWVIVDEDVVIHSGSWLGARTLIVRNRKNKRCRVLLDNALNFRLDNIAQEIGKSLPIRA